MRVGLGYPTAALSCTVTLTSNTYTAARSTEKVYITLQHADFCQFLLGWVEAPGSCQGPRGGPQSAKQGLLCCQEEAAVPQDEGNCQCRTGVSLQSCLYHVSQRVQHVPFDKLCKGLAFTYSLGCCLQRYRNFCSITCTAALCSLFLVPESASGHVDSAAHDHYSR